MKLAYFNDHTLGVIVNDAIIDVSAAVSDTGASSPQAQLEAVISGWDTYGATHRRGRAGTVGNAPFLGQSAATGTASRTTALPGG